ncbi:MAG: phage infection protein, partial [Clostridiales bacterium]|nr:phage infection protein [Clostridiales bacterium]
YLSDLRRLNGYLSLAEEWAEMNGIETYTVHEDEKGNAYIIKNGKTIKLGKPRPKHLKVIE